MEVYPHGPGRSAQLSLGKGSILTYDIVLAGGLENKYRNVQDLLTENVHIDSSTKFTQETYVLWPHCGRPRWEPQSLAEILVGTQCGQVQIRVVNLVTNTPQLSYKDCENTGTFKTVTSGKGEFIWKPDSHAELFLGF